jgi:hypothetical protein
MSIAAFALVINNEIVDVLTAPSPSKLATSLDLNPTVVEITNLSTMPPVGAIWDGENFNVPEDLYPLSEDPYTELNLNVFRVFAYIVNNVFVGRTVLRRDMHNLERLFSVLASNPEFINITAQTIAINVDPFSKLGMSIIDGQIVSQ